MRCLGPETLVSFRPPEMDHRRDQWLRECQRFYMDSPRQIARQYVRLALEWLLVAAALERSPATGRNSRPTNHTYLPHQEPNTSNLRPGCYECIGRDSETTAPGILAHRSGSPHPCL